MADLSFEDLDKLIREICLGQKIIRVEDQEGSLRPLLFRHPTSEELQFSDFIYEESLREAERRELPSLEDMENTIRERGIFGKSDEDRIEFLQGKIEAQKKVLEKTTRVPARRQRIKDIISGFEDEILQIRLKKDRYLEFTKERKASEEKFLYLTQKGVRDPFTGELHWKTKESFLNEMDFLFRKRVYLEYVVFIHGLPTKDMREIARSNIWRVKYIASIKTGEDLFGKSTSEYTTDQQMLIYWSNFYQSIYEMLPTDRPDDEVIEDDAALDAYMKAWQDEKSRDTSATKQKKGQKGKTAWDHGETLVMKSHEAHTDFKYSKTLAERQKGSGQSLDAAPMGRGKKRS